MIIIYNTLFVHYRLSIQFTVEPPNNGQVGAGGFGDNNYKNFQCLYTSRLYTFTQSKNPTALLHLLFSSPFSFFEGYKNG